MAVLPDKKPVAVATPLSSVLSCLAYSTCSISMVLANKALAATFQINLPVSLVIFQCAAAVLLVECCRYFNVVQYQGFQMDVAVKWLPVNVCFVLMLMTSFMAFKYLNVPMITVFKNLTNVIIVAGDWYWNDQKVTMGVVFAFGIMVVGAVAAAYTDAMFSAVGYFWMGANCCATASYVLYMKSVTKNLELSRFGMVFYNNLLSIPLLLPLAISFGELGTMYEHSDVMRAPSFILVNLVAGSMGFFLNLASLWCVSATSATTYALVGSVNKIPVSLLGVWLFDTQINAKGAMYIIVSMCGGFIYSYVKIAESRRK